MIIYKLDNDGKLKPGKPAQSCDGGSEARTIYFAQLGHLLEGKDIGSLEAECDAKEGHIDGFFASVTCAHCGRPFIDHKGWKEELAKDPVYRHIYGLEEPEEES